MSDIVRQRSIEFRDFSGGLNNYWDPSSIADNELPFLLNMEFTPNGALTSRPPIVDRGLGHPLGASGARLATTAVNQLHRSGGRYALCTMCIGVGQGIALVLERV